MKESCGNKFILNGELQSADGFDNSLVYKGESVYEVIRTFRGTPVFFDDHMERLSQSVKLQNKRQLAGPEQLRDDIIALSRSERRKEINIKIVFNYNVGTENYLIYFIDSAYPSKEQYQRGVKGILFFAERQDPASKVINYRLKSLVHHELIAEGAYEALLVNENNQVTEGSRSNIFFLKDNSLVTAPDGQILKGITRKHILQICSENNIIVEFRCVDASEISGYESVFMSGTSPAVLPFCCINGTFFNPGLPLIKRLRELTWQKPRKA
jgi:branched-chain amino acid aminotransferase